MPGKVVLGDCLKVLKTLPDESVDLIYVDPPFGTQAVQRLRSMKSTRTSVGNVGFGGNRYSHTVVSDIAFKDIHDNFINDFLAPCLVEARRVLKRTGTLYLHMDWHHSHYAKVFLDTLFGRECFLNNIVWCYNWGGRGKRCWPKKHDDILVYVKTEGEHVFNWDDIDRIPYKAPELQKDQARAEAGQVPPDWWEMQIIGTASSERTGYPTQKPLRLVERIIRASSNPGDTVLDFCAGSGTTMIASHRLGRNFIGVDCSEEAHSVMKERFERAGMTDVSFEQYVEPTESVELTQSKPCRITCDTCEGDGWIKLLRRDSKDPVTLVCPEPGCDCGSLSPTGQAHEWIKDDETGELRCRNCESWYQRS